MYILRQIKNSAAGNKLNHIPVPKSMLAMAVVIDEKLAGFLILDNLLDSEAFAHSDVQKLIRFREHAVSAIAKAKTLRLLQEQNQNILSSIRYAKTIQQVMLLFDEKIKSFLKNHFILYGYTLKSGNHKI